MLGQFPTPYPDELIYSVFARYYVRSGYSQYIFVAEDLFQKRNVRPCFEYFPALKSEIVTELTKEKTLQEIIITHTMYPYHCRFLPPERKALALDSLIAMDNNYHEAVLLPKRKDIPTMRYCPVCVQNDRERYGETYWHRIHQIIELPICPIHHCKIISTSFELSGRVSPDFVPAEIVIPYNCLVENYLDEKLCAIADYVNSIFDLPIKMENNIDIARVIKTKTENTKYRSPRGAVYRITALYSDFVDYYSGEIIDLPKQWQIHKILTGQRFDFWDIVILGYFLGVKPSDYLDGDIFDKSQLEMFDERIHNLHETGLSYPKIAEIMQQSVDTIKNAAYAKTRKAVKRASRGGKPGRRPIDWQAMDKEMLPKVKEVIEKLRISKKPQRITVGGVARLVGLKSKRIDKLSLCKAEIEEHCQTQEQNWAQKVAWAFGILMKESNNLSIKKIRLLTNMNTDQISRCLVELRRLNQSIYEAIEKLMKGSEDL